MGIMDSTVRSGFMPHIFTMAMPPMNSASKNISTPQPKQSWTVSRSLVKRLMRLPTLFS